MGKGDRRESYGCFRAVWRTEQTAGELKEAQVTGVSGREDSSPGDDIADMGPASPEARSNGRQIWVESSLPGREISPPSWTHPEGRRLPPATDGRRRCPGGAQVLHLERYMVQAVKEPRAAGREQHKGIGHRHRSTRGPVGQRCAVRLRNTIFGGQLEHRLWKRRATSGCS